MAINVNPDIFILIGLHKTGCTFIQNEVFRKIPKPEVFYTESWETIWGRSNTLVPGSGLSLIANPNLSSVPFASKVYPYRLREMYARDLAVLYPNASVLVGFRERESWLRSLWSQRLHGGSDIGKDFIEFDDFKSEVGEDWFRDDEYVELLRGLFKRVYVYRYETLRDDPALFVKGICDFLGVPLAKWQSVVWKKGLTDDEIEVKRRNSIRELRERAARHPPVHKRNFKVK